MSTTLKIRASSLPSLLDCPARWKAENIDGLRTPQGGAAHLGTSLHHAAGKFDQATVEAAPIEVGDAVDLFIDKVKKPEEPVLWDSKLTEKRAIDSGVTLMQQYCIDVAPAHTYTAVEIRCDDVRVDMGDGIKIVLTGQPDRIRSEPSGSWEDDRQGIVDLKSGARIINAQGEVAIDKHIAQLGQYELLELLLKQKQAYEFTLPAEIIALPTSGSGQKIATATVDRPSKILLGDGERKGLLHVAAKMAKDDLFPGNVRSQLCSERYCPIHSKCWWRGNA